jgi:hypothetical protein
MMSCITLAICIRLVTSALQAVERGTDDCHVGKIVERHWILVRQNGGRSIAGRGEAALLKTLIDAWINSFQLWREVIAVSSSEPWPLVL